MVKNNISEIIIIKTHKKLHTEKFWCENYKLFFEYWGVYFFVYKFWRKKSYFRGSIIFLHISWFHSYFCKQKRLIQGWRHP